MSAPTRVWIAEAELGESLAPAGVSRGRRSNDEAARVLVRMHGQVLGFASIALPAGEIDEGTFASAVSAQLGPALADHLRRDGLDETQLGTDGSDRTCKVRGGLPTTTGMISVVVCTRGRPESLRTCLERLQHLRYPDFEVIVVDNAPTGAETHGCFLGAVGDDPRFRYVCEPVPGLSRARNRGLAEAAARYVAFTDDDVQVDPLWLDGISAGFARDPHAGCVTGLVPPAELEHPTQHYFDRRYTWAEAMEPCVYDLTNGRAASPLYPYSAGVFGTGANFAVDRFLFAELGGFDEALGAGSLARGGEDLDAFVRVLRAGRTLVYEPSALVWHAHRSDPAALRSQLFAYGMGLTAFLTKYATGRETSMDIWRRLPSGARRIRHMWAPAAISGPAPRSLMLAEAMGLLAGPQAYLRGRRRLRRDTARP